MPTMRQKAETVKEYLRSQEGITEDRFGNFKIENNGSSYRFHFKKQIIRFEYLSRGKHWYKLASFGITAASKKPAMLMKMRALQ